MHGTTLKIQMCTLVKSQFSWRSHLEVWYREL